MEHGNGVKVNNTHRTNITVNTNVALAADTQELVQKLIKIRQIMRLAVKH